MSGGGSVVTAGGRAAPGIGRERAGVQLHIPQMTGAPPPPRKCYPALMGMVWRLETQALFWPEPLPARRAGASLTPAGEQKP